jgi:hypothetical protein
LETNVLNTGEKPCKIDVLARIQTETFPCNQGLFPVYLVQVGDCGAEVHQSGTKSHGFEK